MRTLGPLDQSLPDEQNELQPFLQAGCEKTTRLTGTTSRRFMMHNVHKSKPLFDLFLLFVHIKKPRPPKLNNGDTGPSSTATWPLGLIWEVVAERLRKKAMFSVFASERGAS